MQQLCDYAVFAETPQPLSERLWVLGAPAGPSLLLGCWPWCVLCHSRLERLQECVVHDVGYKFTCMLAGGVIDAGWRLEACDVDAIDVL